jgi:hypothetical protein
MARASGMVVGTGVRRALDTRKLSQVVERAGIDPRLWCSRGVVATMGDDGEIDTSDWRAILLEPGGCKVDVYLEPSKAHITAHYAGISGGRAAHVMAPIRPGDGVLVILSGGDASQEPVIVAILNNQAHPVPAEPGGQPVWKNDRLLVRAEAVPVDIETAGGARVRLKQDATVEVSGSKVSTITDDTRLGSTNAAEALVLGTSYRAAEQPAFTSLAAWVAAVSAVIADPGIIPTTPAGIAAKAATATLAAALGPLLGPLGSDPFLSAVSRTR